MLKKIFSLLNHIRLKDKLNKNVEIRPEIIAIRPYQGVLSYDGIVDDVFNINYNINKKKEENHMLPIDINKATAYFENIKIQRDNAVNNALLGLTEAVENRIREKRPEIESEIKAELISKAEEPYLHDLELYEKFKTEPLVSVASPDDEIEVNPDTETMV